MAHDAMREVVLTEDQPAADDSTGVVSAVRSGRHGPGETLAGRRAASPRTRRWWVLALAAVLAAVGVVDGVAGARDRERLARLADLPGVLQPLGPGIGTLWEHPAGRDRWLTAEGDVLVADRTASASHVLHLVDGATGERRWTSPLPELGPAGGVECVALAPGTGATAGLACRLATGVTQLGFSRTRLGAGGRTLLVVLDPDTGRRVAEQGLGSRYPNLAAAGTDLVLTEVGEDGHASITRADPRTGTARWVFRSREPLAPTTALSALAPPVAVVRHGVIAVDGLTGWALGLDGEPIGEWHPRRPASVEDVQPGVEVTVLADGRVVVGEPRAGRQDGQSYGTVVAAGTRPAVAVPGPVLQPVVDDGSGGEDVLLTVPLGRGQVVAVDAATGRRLWTTPSRGDAVVLGGRLVTQAGDDVRAVDARSGAPAWRAHVTARRSAHHLLTDGRVVLVATSDSAGRPTLTALDVTDGSARWSAPVPDGVDEYVVAAGRLLAVTDGAVIALG